MTFLNRIISLLFRGRSRQIEINPEDTTVNVFDFTEEDIRETIEKYCREELGVDNVSTTRRKINEFVILHVVWNDDTKDRLALALVEVGFIEIYSNLARICYGR